MRGTIFALLLFLLVQLGRPSPCLGRGDVFAVPTLRPNIGALSTLLPASETGLALHVPVGAQIGWADNALGRLFGATPWLFPELAYELRSTEHTRSHAFSAGLGVGYGLLALAMVSYTPRFLVGTTNGETSWAFRHSIGGHFLMSVIYVEISHEVRRVSASQSHELQFTVGLNVGTLFLPLLFG